MGWRSHAQFGLEDPAAWGTPVAPTLSMPFIAESFKATREQIENNSIRGGRGASDSTDGIYDHGGGVNFAVDPDNICLILKAAMGAPVTTYAGDGAYQHVFTLKDDIYPMTAEIDRDGFVFQALGCVIDSLHFSCDINGLLLCDAAMESMKDFPYSYTTAVYGTGKPFNFKDVGDNGAWIDSVANYFIKGFDLTLANALKKDYRSFASGIFRRGLPYGRSAVSGTMKMNFETDAEFERFWGASGGPIQYPANVDLLTHFGSNQQIGTSSYYCSIEFQTANTKYTSVDAPVTGPDALEQTIPYTCKETAAGLSDDLKVTVYNSQASI
jgi:hypothetical protein